MRTWTRWQSWLNLLVGAWLFISPWVLRSTDVSDGATNAWALGVITVLAALWAAPARRAVPPPRPRRSDGSGVMRVRSAERR